MRVSAARRRILDELVELGRRMGDPSLDWAILAEGNLSADCGDGSFWVKASGTSLHDAVRGSFVLVDGERALGLLERESPGDEQIRAGLLDATLCASQRRLPSVETVMHAVCLRCEGVRFVGHTHPAAINAITCSRGFEEALGGSLFPDQVVVCGPAAVLVPYVDPGIPLARELRRLVEAFAAARGETPRAVYLQNHGFMALGGSAREVMDITAMADKAARIVTGTYALGGPRFLGEPDVRRIEKRPDELHRRRMLGLR
jgi:rhamnose utilization protein RhaD (predicted bifunctional aldolase and dehydrogenase)